MEEKACNESRAEASIRHVQAGWQSADRATRTVATRATRSLDSEDVMQADGDTVKKVASNELYISPTLDRTVKALPEGLWLGRQVPHHAHE